MEIIAVKANADCFKKNVSGLSIEKEATKFGDPKNSHAISYFLGNDALFCLEECKGCNNTFGSTIENALSNYYQYYRAAEHRKSRKGNPLTAKGINYEATSDGGMRIFQSEPIENAPRVGEKLSEDGLLVHLHNREPVVLHDIYRVLCKYVIACLPGDLMPAFKDTVKWIKGEKHPHRGVLPPVYRIETLEEVAKRYPDATFTVQNYCDDEPKMITNHVKIEGDGNEVLRPLTDEQIAQAEAAYNKIPPEKRM